MRLSKNKFTNKKHDLSEHEFKLGACCKYGHHMSVLDQKEWSQEGVTVNGNERKMKCGWFED